MASLPTGSDKLLEITASGVTLIVKTKKAQALHSADAEARSSSLVINGTDVEVIRVPGQDIHWAADGRSGISTHHMDVFPMFYEQTDYEIIVSCGSDSKVSFWNENYSVREKVSPVMEGNEALLSGIINFGNEIGFSEFEISRDGKKILTVRIEVYPSKISYKSDYQIMISDISDMVYAAALDFMQKTYQEFSIGDRQNNVPSVFFQVISAIFEKYMNAVNRIVSVPHHKLMTEHLVLPEHKIRKADRKSEKWLQNHQEYIVNTKDGYSAEKALSVRKTITYDTAENRFVRYILKATLRKLSDFRNRYSKTVRNPEQSVMDKTDAMTNEIRRILSISFLKDVSDYDAMQSMSLVFGMAPGYRELYKYYLMLQLGLAVNGDVFRISVKDTAQLYEYWCFIKLFSLLKKEYKLDTPDIIRADNSGVTVTLVHGKKSEARFINPSTGEKITLVYNPGETATQTVNQRPDNVLELEKTGTDISYKYIFDAKYRIESDPDGIYYPDDKPGPKVDDINTMHRYRDSIVYENSASKFTFEKTMFGAYILFPYDKWEDYAFGIHKEGKTERKGHKFYRSIDSVNIGGLPFLPGSTELVKKLLDELISDSKESAFERATLPRGIEEKLAVVDWNRRDVLVGTFRDKKQFDVCFINNFYYVPARSVPDKKLPVRYVALYQSVNIFGSEAGISYFGEVIFSDKISRSEVTEIPVRSGNADELYYRFEVGGWHKLARPVRPKEKAFPVSYTNKFLLEHSEYVPELLIENEDEYRFYSELKRNVHSAEINEAGANISFAHGNTKFVFTDGYIFAVCGDKISAKVAVTDFSKRPSAVLRTLQAAVETSIVCPAQGDEENGD